LEVSGAVRPIYGSLGVKRLNVSEVTFLLHRSKMTGLRLLAGKGAYLFLIIVRPALWPTHTSV